MLCELTDVAIGCLCMIDNVIITEVVNVIIDLVNGRCMSLTK